MALFPIFLLPLLLLATLFSTHVLCYINPVAARVQQDAAEASAYHTYIVLVEPPRSDTREDAHRRWHESFLQSSCEGESAESRLLHSYTEVFSGFAARLTGAELDAVSKKSGFVRAFPSRTLQPMTTHTPEFLGLRNDTGVWSDAGYGKGVIIGLLDTGLYATHPSFDDHGVPPPPARWKGSCKAARCNNKLIGAKSFVGDEDSSDEVGHGTHTSSIAAGNFVPGASYHGVGTGTAAGVAPGAHIAMYKVCRSMGCDDANVLAGLDMAIKDGVDVLSISLGGTMGIGFDLDPIAIGAFSAVSKGILVICAAGNNGDWRFLVVNDAPWLLTVAAGSTDRSFGAEVRLGNGKKIHGEALTQKASTSSRSYPLVFLSKENRYCEHHNTSSIAGKILVCEVNTAKNQKSDISNIMGAGAAGVVLFNDDTSGYTTELRDFNSSVVQLTAADGAILTSYATSRETNKPVASFTYNNTLFGIRPAPVVSWFSSRGPSSICISVIKPDILAPGLNILAAWPPKTASASGPYNIMSGTSMATPHISGVAALIKSIHPNWSPSAIKSAIMTTSDIVDSTGGSILDQRHMKATVYDTGAGHVNPTRAIDPGLVYDLNSTDYAGLICSLLGDAGLGIIVRNSSLTCAMLTKVKPEQLNYPTITVPFTSVPFTVNRTVTNVGPETSTYTVKVDVPNSMVVRVFPETLKFSKAGEKKTFSLSVSSHSVGKEEFVEGSLSWVSEKHVVRSPIVARALVVLPH